MRLQEIVDSIDAVRETISIFRIGFNNYVNPSGVFDDTCRRAIDMPMLQLCEEAREVTNETRNRVKGIPWSSIAEVRNYLVHSYGSIDAAEMWNIIENDLVELRDAYASLITEIESGAYVPRFGSRTKERNATPDRGDQ